MRQYLISPRSLKRGDLESLFEGQPAARVLNQNLINVFLCVTSVQHLGDNVFKDVRVAMTSVLGLKQKCRKHIKLGHLRGTLKENTSRATIYTKLLEG